jgi:acetyl esterase/lipase
MTSVQRTAVLFLSLLLAVVALTRQEASALPAATNPAAIQVARDITYRTVEGQALKFDSYWPAVWAANRPAVVLVHGGAWSGGDKSSMDWMGRQLAANGYVAFAINYRLTSATPWPAEIQDVQEAIRFVRSRAAKNGIDPTRIGVLGDSAGGNLVSLAGAKGSGSWSTDARVKAVVAFSGVYDLNALPAQVVGDPARSWLGTSVAKYTGCATTDLTPACVGTRWVASSVNYVDPTDPPQLLIDSTDELVPLLQGVVMEARLRAGGVPVERTTYVGNEHGVKLFDDGLAQTLSFLARNL